MRAAPEPGRRTLTRTAQAAVAAVLRPGDLAVDATVGNGHDTLFLARAVGPTGRVIGFDVQARALQATRTRLANAPGIAAVELHLADHEHLATYLPGSPPPGAVMFNLGYLPGGDKALVTRPPGTLAALRSAWSALRPGGVISLLVYVGHPGGADELRAVRGWLAGLEAPQRAWRELRGPAATSPVLFLLYRQRSAPANRVTT